MAQRRSEQVDPKVTRYYHCRARCVRRAMLCGHDTVTGRDFSHRKQWIVDRLKLLAVTFDVGICAYAIMSNHYHLVVRSNDNFPDWSTSEVIARWTRLYKSTELVDRYKDGNALSPAETRELEEWVAVRRTRLGSLSWFMANINEYIARRANKEDEVSGRFWEGRFGSGALLGETALLTCMAYVDLNPIRAALCKSLESSNYTSIQHRLYDYLKKKRGRRTTQGANDNEKNARPRDGWLLPLSKAGISPGKCDLPMTEENYFAFVDWTGRIIRNDKPGAIPAHIMPILDRLQIDENNWAQNITQLGSRFHRAIGSVSGLRELAVYRGQHWICGLEAGAQLYRNPLSKSLC